MTGKVSRGKSSVDNGSRKIFYQLAMLTFFIGVISSCVPPLPYLPAPYGIENPRMVSCSAAEESPCNIPKRSTFNAGERVCIAWTEVNRRSNHELAIAVWYSTEFNVFEFEEEEPGSTLNSRVCRVIPIEGLLDGGFYSTTFSADGRLIDEDVDWSILSPTPTNTATPTETPTVTLTPTIPTATLTLIPPDIPTSTPTLSPTMSPTPIPNSLLVADFCSGTNNLGGAMGAAYEGGNILIESYGPHADRNCAARLEYNIQAWAAFWMKLQGQDLTPYSRLTFDIRGDSAVGIPGQMKIELKRAENSEVSIEYIEKVTDSWQTRSVNLEGFSGSLSSWTAMEELVFTFEVPGSGNSGVVYLDQVQFQP